MAMNGGCGFPVINFGPKVEGEPLKCGTKLYWGAHCTGTFKEEILLCRSCTEKQAAEELATAPTKETHVA